MGSLWLKARPYLAGGGGEDQDVMLARSPETAAPQRDSEGARPGGKAQSAYCP